GKYAECEKLWRQALEEAKGSGGQSLREATSSLDLSRLLHVLGRYKDAESLIELACGIRQEQLGKQHLQIAECFSMFAQNQALQGNVDEFEDLYNRALQIREKHLGKKHPDVADSLQELATFYASVGQYEECLNLLEKTLEVRETVSPYSMEVANTLKSL